MSNRELAEFIDHDVTHCTEANPVICSHEEWDGNLSPCGICFYKWLGKEAEENA